jgi:hypothetical protein
MIPKYIFNITFRFSTKTASLSFLLPCSDRFVIIYKQYGGLDCAKTRNIQPERISVLNDSSVCIGVYPMRAEAFSSRAFIACCVVILARTQVLTIFKKMSLVKLIQCLVLCINCVYINLISEVARPIVTHPSDSIFNLI